MGLVEHVRGREVGVGSRSLDERANQLAHHLWSEGVRGGDLVGVYTYNRAEHVEALLACWKISAVPINVNYRYVADELRYVWGDAGLVALIAERTFVPLINELAGEFPDTRTYVLLEDGTDHKAEFDHSEYETALAAQPAARERYEALSYTHRREFAEWVAEAKKQETRDRRAAGAVEMLLEGRTR